MKRILYMCLFVILSLPTLSLAAAIGPARVSYVDGDLMFRAPDDEEWLAASVNTPLDEGDVVWCADGGRAEIQLPDGSIVRLDSGSQLDLLANEDGFVHLHLASGHLYLRTTLTTRINSLQIDANDTTVLPAARTRLRMDIMPNGLEDVAITRGSAYVEGYGSRTRVRGGEHILLEEGHSEVLPLNPADSWELWNIDRDREQARFARGDSYLPDELRGHAAELDANGSWVYVPEYGRIWRPTAIDSDDWAPYREGRWIWNGDDYVWLSSEPWGWVPYHFGRWAVVSGLGWCWVPPVRGNVYWGPGNVGWYSTGGQVGWTPLAPGEKYYSHRNYGPDSVNITRVNINPGLIVYKNRSRRGGLTVQPDNEFLRGRSARQQPAGRNPLSLSISVGSPRLQPLRETRMPIVRQTPPRVAPPRIEQRDNRELRNRFPRISPEPALERRRQQPSTPPPALTRPARPAAPFAQPQQPDRRQREERRGERPPPAAPQPVLPAAHNPPPLSGSVPQRTEQPRRAPAPSDSYNRPAAAPPRREVRPAIPDVPAAIPPKAATPQRVEQPRRGPTPQVIQPKKVWKVTTPESGTEKDTHEKDNRGRERRE